jgi:hypothetical protein
LRSPRRRMGKVNLRDALEVKRGASLVGKEYTRVTTLVVKPPGKLTAWELLPKEGDFDEWEAQLTAFVKSAPEP